MRVLFSFSCPCAPEDSLRSPCIGLGYRLDSPQIAVATEPYPNRWTHHVPVTDAAQLDEELLGWLREAYNFADGKSR